MFYVAFELNNNTKKIDQAKLLRDIKRHLISGNCTNKLKRSILEPIINSLKIFLPFRELQKGGFFLKEKSFYLPGYCFVEFYNKIDYIYLEGIPYVNSVLKNEETGELSLIESSIISEEERKMEDFFKCQFREGQLIEVVDGDFANLLGRVVGFDTVSGKYKVIIYSYSCSWRKLLYPHQLGTREEDKILSDDLDTGDNN